MVNTAENHSPIASIMGFIRECSDPTCLWGIDIGLTLLSLAAQVKPSGMSIGK